MLESQHVIKHNILKMSVLADVNYLDLKNITCDILTKTVYPKLGIICDKYSIAHKHYNINKLEIELGKIDLSDLETSLIEQLPKKFEAALLLALDLKGSQKQEKDVFIKEDEIAGKWQIVNYFLKTGNLIWRYNNQSLNYSPSKILLDLAIEFPHKTKNLLNSLDINAWARLVIAHTDLQLEALAQALLYKKQTDFVKLHHDLQKMLSVNNRAINLPSAKLRYHYWSFILLFALKNTTAASDIEGLIDSFFAYLTFILQNTNYYASYENLTAKLTKRATGLLQKGQISSSSINLWLKAKNNKKNTVQLNSLSYRQDEFKGWLAEPTLVGEHSRTSQNSLVNSLVDDAVQLLYEQDIDTTHISFKEIFSSFIQIAKILREFTILPAAQEEKAYIYRILKLFKKCNIKSITASNNLELVLKLLLKFITCLKQRESAISCIQLNSFKLLCDNYEKLKFYHEKVFVKFGRAKSIQEPQRHYIQDLSYSHTDSINSSGTIYINNAGLIIYWAYLQPLFAKLKFLDHNHQYFINKEVNIRAALLLNLFVQNNNKNVIEYELALNKLLCGLPIDAPLPHSLRIKRAESEECKNLTKLLIANWPALGTINNSSFNESFVRRFGAIKYQEKQWLLQVEKKPQDILLNKLPWPINVIKLPWMRAPIIVEW